MVNQLFPVAGSKASPKYDCCLYPELGHIAICEPFMGSAARSLRYSNLDCYLGDTDAGKRAIAQVLQYPEGYIKAYKAAVERFWAEFDEEVQELVLSYERPCDKRGRKLSRNLQSLLKKEMPSAYQQLKINWQSLVSDLYQWWILDSEAARPDLAGTYAFCIRAVFGNILRLTPAGDGFNVNWHIDKAAHACRHQPDAYIKALINKRWKPLVFASWAEAIAAVAMPEKTFLLLDPPYAAGIEGKIHPCYPGHQVKAGQEHEFTLGLATNSLVAGLERGFDKVAVCNYYSAALAEAIRDIYQGSSYCCQEFRIGSLPSLRNSNGQRKKFDPEIYSAEHIWVLEKSRSRVYFSSSKPAASFYQPNLPGL